MRRLLRLADVAATERLGRTLARSCPWSARAPLTLFLSGELGTGKTTLTGALLAELGVAEPVRSPSYALIETYPLEARLAVHVDLYRLEGRAELEQLGLRDYLTPDTLLIVEWPEHAAGGLPRADLMLALSVVGEGRDCRIESGSAVGEQWLSRADAATHDLLQSGSV